MNTRIIPGKINDVQILFLPEEDDDRVSVLVRYEYLSEAGGFRSDFVLWKKRIPLEWFLTDLLSVAGVSDLKDLTDRNVRLQMGPEPETKQTLLVGIAHETDDEWLWTL